MKVRACIKVMFLTLLLLIICCVTSDEKSSYSKEITAKSSIVQGHLVKKQKKANYLVTNGISYTLARQISVDTSQGKNNIQITQIPVCSELPYQSPRHYRLFS
ncbi:MAG: hypothetical protein Q8930_05220 [Bacillota bacterium]|nr:hypothetical protein [Bacillota bacterium]